MEEIKHSPIGGSTCHRWWECPGSVALCASLPKPEQSFAAAEGTAAHQIAENALKLIKEGRKIDLYSWIGYTRECGNYEIEVTEDMVDAVIVYLDSIKHELARFGTGKSFLSIEAPFQLAIDKEAYGTNDASLYKPFDCVYIWEYKHGKGVVVEVKDNKQLLFYGLGAIKGRDVQKVVTYVVQPRAYHPDGAVRKCVYTIDEINQFEIELNYAIKRTRQPDAPLKAGDHCKFCPAIGDCPEVRAETQMVAKQDFAKVSSLDTDKLIRLVELTPRITDFLKEAHLRLTNIAERGEEVSGFKLVKARSNRKWKSEARVIADFKATIGKEMFQPPKLLSPAQMEKKCGKMIKEDALLPYIEKPDTGLTLVKNSDARLAVKSSASEDFKGIE